MSSLKIVEEVIDRCTDEKNTKDDWNQIYDCVEKISCLGKHKDVQKIFIKKLKHRNPHVSMQTLTLLDSCVNNCGKEFHRELCSRVFISELKTVVSSKNLNARMIQRLKSLIQKWVSLEEIKSDSALDLLRSYYTELKASGHSFDYQDDKGSLEATANAVKPPASTATVSDIDQQRREEEELAAAIALSLKEQDKKSSSSNRTSAAASSSLYPSFGSDPAASSNHYRDPSPAASAASKMLVRALYDFEAAEDNELTFKTGDLIHVTDSSDPNWWQGYTQSGMQGLFPATFVEEHTESNKKEKKSVVFNEEVRVLQEEPLRIDGAQIDSCLAMLENCDPTGDPDRPDPPELPALEERCRQMAPLIDNEIEKLDKNYLGMHQLNSKMSEAFQMYHQLMNQIPPNQSYQQATPHPPQQQAVGYPPPQQPPMNYQQATPPNHQLL